MGPKFRELCINGTDWYEYTRSNGQAVLISYDKKFYCEI